MSELKDAIANLVPLAEALLLVNSKLDQLDLLDQELSESDKALAEAEARAAKAEATRVAAGVGAEKAKAEIIEARANCDKMVSSARVVAARLIDEAKAQATTEAEGIKSALGDSIVMLTQKEAEARKALAQVEASLAARRTDHDQVLASIASLKNRLGAA